MSRPLISANAGVRLALRDCFEKDRYRVAPDSVSFFRRYGMPRFAIAAAVLRHLREGRNLYLKLNDQGAVLERNFHGEVSLHEDDAVIAYMHFILNSPQTSAVLRAHVNGFPASLPWSNVLRS